MSAEIVAGKTVVLGVTGGIAVYKAADTCSTLVKLGADVHVIMTEHAQWFVGPGTFRALTGNQVLTGIFDEPEKYEIQHVSLSERADVMLIAPATANIIGKIASGIADDMLSTTVMAAICPVILAPAMNCRMWGNRIVKSNVDHLRSLGYRFVGPEKGRLACGEVGVGRLAQADDIIAEVVRAIERKQDLQGVSILVTAGPTQEPIDPVRFISNYSSGKMGYAIAKAAAERGASVTLVSGPTGLVAPSNISCRDVSTAQEMFDTVMKELPGAQVVIGAAAVADYRPKSPAESKIKKKSDEMTVELVPNPDIVAEVGRRKGDRILVAFAAETDHVLENAGKKLDSKNADFVVANDVSRTDIGFGADENQVTIIGRDGQVELPRLPKSEVADRILDRVKEALGTTRA